MLSSLDDKTRYMVCFPVTFGSSAESNSATDDAGHKGDNGEMTDASETPDPLHVLKELHEDGFVRAIVGDTTVRLDDGDTLTRLEGEGVFECGRSIDLVVDRLTGGTDAARVRDSLETAFAHGTHTRGRATVLIDAEALDSEDPIVARGAKRTVDGRDWMKISFNQRLRCDDCGIAFPTPSPKLFSFNSPLGACPTCEGFGNLVGIDMDLVVPDNQSRSAMVQSCRGVRPPMSTNCDRSSISRTILIFRSTYRFAISNRSMSS